MIFMPIIMDEARHVASLVSRTKDSKKPKPKKVVWFAKICVEIRHVSIMLHYFWRWLPIITNWSIPHLTWRSRANILLNLSVSPVEVHLVTRNQVSTPMDHLKHHLRWVVPNSITTTTTTFLVPVVWSRSTSNPQVNMVLRVWVSINRGWEVPARVTTTDLTRLTTTPRNTNIWQPTMVMFSRERSECLSQIIILLNCLMLIYLFCRVTKKSMQLRLHGLRVLS